MSLRPTSNERQLFDDQYDDLSTMLALFWDPNGKTDAEIAREAIQEYDRSWLEQVVAEGQRFLAQHELPMSLIRVKANRYLITEAEQRQWLQTLLDRIQAELEARNQASASTRA